jgi:sporulation related protein
MLSRHVSLSALLLLTVCSQVLPKPAHRSSFTLQVGSFTDATRASKLITLLKEAGEAPYAIVADLGDRGSWTRVFVGVFATIDAAHRYGRSLRSRAIIPDFIVKTSAEIESVMDAAAPSARYSAPSTSEPPTAAKASTSSGDVRSTDRTRPRRVSSIPTSTALPPARSMSLALSPRADIQSLPRHNPVAIALELISGNAKTALRGSGQHGGLWVSGDVSEGLARLRWIAGPDAALISLDDHGRLLINETLLAGKAGAEHSNSPEAPAVVTKYIVSNEGLLLLAQLASGTHRYLLHIGRTAPTRGGMIEVGGGVNLDNNYDRRINPHRRTGNKLDAERPPIGFDCMVAMNPTARWFNLGEQCMVPVGHVTFHELAEAYAKLELGIEYLGADSSVGAHEVALAREQVLKEQRPFSVVMTAGSNRVLKSEDEIRQFYQVSARSGAQR